MIVYYQGLGMLYHVNTHDIVTIKTKLLQTSYMIAACVKHYLGLWLQLALWDK